MPSGSTWMMLVGGAVLLSGLVLVGWVLLDPPASTTLEPGASVVAEVNLSGEDLLLVEIRVQDPGPGLRLAVFVQAPSGVQATSVGTAGERTLTVRTGETGVHTVVIENVGTRTIALDYRATAMTRAEIALANASVPLVIAGAVILVGGLGLRFLWKGLRGYWET